MLFSDTERRQHMLIQKYRLRLRPKQSVTISDFYVIYFRLNQSFYLCFGKINKSVPGPASDNRDPLSGQYWSGCVGDLTPAMSIKLYV